MIAKLLKNCLLGVVLQCYRNASDETKGHSLMVSWPQVASSATDR